MRIALYGLPCAGKTMVLSALNNVKVVNGSAELNRMTGEKFRSLREEEKLHYRIKYIEYIMSLNDEIVISDGHYSFLDNVVFTDHDARAYDVFIYLYCSAETLLNRYACSEKNKKYSELSVERIEQWQSFEIEQIRHECHKNNKDFYVINGEKISAGDFTSFLEKIKEGYSSYALAKSIVENIKDIYPKPCQLALVDGDKTLIVQDSFRVCSHGYKTSVFDGDFYTGFESLMFAEEEKKVEYDFELLNQIDLNRQVFETIQNMPYFVISAGVTQLWKKLAKMHCLKNVVANPLISADTKYFVVKILQGEGYSVKAYIHIILQKRVFPKSMHLR